MDKLLWKSIENFDIEFVMDGEEFDFVTHLAFENAWTSSFTKRVVLEYKKFMFLAATLERKVVPSSFVEAVWQSHFSCEKSYTDFCNLLGKQIVYHSTSGQPKDYEKLKKANEWTKSCYKSCFGDQPTDVWFSQEFLEDIPITPSKWGMKGTYLLIFLSFALVLPLSFLMLNDVFLNLPDEIFILGDLAFLPFLLLWGYWLLRKRSRNFWKKLVNHPEIQSLNASELAYLKRSDLLYVMHAALNSLIHKGQLKILKNKYFQLVSDERSKERVENYIIRSFEGVGSEKSYEFLQLDCLQALNFLRIKFSVGEIREKIQNAAYNQVTYMQLAVVFSTYLGIGFARLLSELMVGAPTTIMIITLVGLSLFFLLLSYFAFNYIFEKALPVVLKTEQSQDLTKKPELGYIVHGKSALAPDFFPASTKIQQVWEALLYM